MSNDNGVQAGASKDEVKAAFRKLMEKFRDEIIVVIQSDFDLLCEISEPLMYGSDSDSFEAHRLRENWNSWTNKEKQNGN